MKNTKQKGFTLPRNVNAEGGFTLIELLIVIGIIAILAAAVIIAINPGQQFQQARNATRWSHMNSVANAVYSYAIQEGGAFPDCSDDTDDTDEPDPLGDGTDFNDERDIVHCEPELVTTGGHMSELPLDPITGDTGGDTGYEISSDGTRIKITSTADEADEIEVIQ